MSGVYVPEWEIPMYCNDCPFDSDGTCFLNDDIICTYEPVTRAADCPLTPVPDHGDLVDVNDILKDREGLYIFRGDYRISFCQIIERAPTIIPADKEADT